MDQKESMYRAGGCNDQPVRTNLGVVELDSFIRGYHDHSYKDIWPATVGDMVHGTEPTNPRDVHAEG